jgi:hypothetical protein
MRKNPLILCLSVIACICTASAQQTINIVTGGKSNYRIVIPANANSLEVRSANVLQQYLHKISNCTLPISAIEGAANTNQIVIGKTNKVSPSDLKNLGDDGILIKRIDNTIVLTGGKRIGVLYSVFTFLEDYLGCQAYTPEVIEVPKKSTITLPAVIYKKQNPAFSYRMTFFPNLLLGTPSYEFSDWRKMNYFKEGWGLWVHSFETLLPKAQYFAAHPEYFALINGKRNPAQPDLTNPNVLRIVIDNLRALIKANPAPAFWSVSQNDTPTNQEHCECPNCKKLDTEQGSPQGSLLTFVNAVAKEFPDKMITTLAYGYSQKPPKNLKPGGNVIVMLCATGQNLLDPLSSKNNDFNRDLEKWGQTTNNLFLWDYIVKFDQTLLPLPNMKILQSNIRYFLKNNVKYLFEQGSGDVVGEFSELKCYLVAKLMWDVNTNFESAITNFLNYYYGKTGATFVRQYLDGLHKNAATGNSAIYTSGNITPTQSSYLSNGNINTYKSFFKKALNAVDSNSVYGKRILKEYIGVLYAELENNKYQFSQQKQLNRQNKSNYINSLNYWYKKIKAANITSLAEGGRDVDSYFKSYSDQLNNYPLK